jgi:hypothetical protein
MFFPVPTPTSSILPLASFQSAAVKASFVPSPSLLL